MKKILLLASIFLITSTMANACEGITVKNKYCLSKQKMNWFSAYAWCKDQGKQLFDLINVCGSSTSCSALKLSTEEQNNITANGGQITRVWSNTSVTNTNAFSVGLTDGGIDNGRYSYNHSWRLHNWLALCE